MGMITAWNIRGHESALTIRNKVNSAVAVRGKVGEAARRAWPTESCCCCWVPQSRLTLGYLHGLQHTKLPGLSPSPGACPNSCPLSQWCYPTISSSVVPFSSCLQSFPASGSFPVSQFFTSGSQSWSSWAPAWASVLPVNIQGWFPLVLTCLISLLSKELPRVFSKTTVQKQQFFGLQPSLHPTLISVHDYWKNHSFD